MAFQTSLDTKLRSKAAIVAIVGEQIYDGEPEVNIETMPWLAFVITGSATEYTLTTYDVDFIAVSPDNDEAAGIIDALYDAIHEKTWPGVLGAFHQSSSIEPEDGYYRHTASYQIVYDNSDVPFLSVEAIDGTTQTTLDGYLKGSGGLVTAQAVPIPVNDGGTGATTAAAARTSLGVPAGSGTSTGTNTGDQDLSSYATTAAVAAAYQPLDGDLSSLAGASSTNALYYRSASNTWTPVTVGGNLSFSGGTLNGQAGTVTSVNLTQPAAGITVSGGPVTSSGSITLALANDLGAVEGLSSTGLATRTAADTWTTRTITGSGVISVTNGNGVSGNPTVSADLSAYLTIAAAGLTYALANDLANYQPLDADLTAVAGLSSTGIVTRTSNGSMTTRTITGTSGTITVTNGSGVSGNPTLTIDSSYVGQTSITTLGTIGTGTWNAGAGTFTAPSAGTIALVAKGASSHTASVFEAQNSGGTPYVKIGPPTLTGSSTTSNWLNVTGTLPTSLSAAARGVVIDVTANTFSTQGANAIYASLGGTATAICAAVRGDCTTVSTSNDGPQGDGNVGVLGVASGTTTGCNFGVFGDGRNGNVSIGVGARANTAKNSATNIGVLGSGMNTGTSASHFGGIFTLRNTQGSYGTSAALMCDNYSFTDNIFQARDNGIICFTIADGGNTTIAMTNATNVALTVRGAASQSSNLLEFQDSTSAVKHRFNKDGRPVHKHTSAPADADLAAGEMSVWFDSTNGASKLMVKAKSADGTVVTGSLALA